MLARRARRVRRRLFVLSLSLAALGASGLVGLGCNDEPARQAPAVEATPVVEMLEIEARELKPGESTTVKATASDPEGRTLEYDWSVEDSAWRIEAAEEAGAATLTAPDEYGAEVTVALRVTAKDGEATSEPARITAETVENQLPQLGGLSASPNPVRPGGTVTLAAEATDGNGDELTFEWAVGGEWSLASTSGKQAELTAPEAGESTARVQLTVTDAYGGTTTDSLSVSTRENGAPTIASMTAAPPQVEPGGTTTVRVAASDPEGEDLNYTWTAPDEWTIEGEGAEVTVTAPDSWGASAEIRVEVDDGPKSTAASVVVSTPENDGPVIATLDATPKTVAKGGTVDLQVSAADPDGDMLSYTWAVDSPKWTLMANGERATLQAPDLPDARVSATVTVADGEGHEAEASVIVSTRANRAPLLTALDATPRQVAPGATAQLSASAQDPDGDTLSYEWSATGKWTITGSGANVQVKAPDSYGTTGTVSVNVKDGLGGTAGGTIQVLTEGNAAPVVSSMTASPDVLQPGGTTSVEVLANDPNGDPLTYSWTVPSGWAQKNTGQPHAIDVTAPNQTSQTARIRVEIHDNNGGTTRAAVAVRTRLNQPPVIKSLTASPTTVEPDATTTVQAVVDDGDGDAITYNWVLPKGWTGSSTTSSIQATAPREYGKTVDIELKAGDGKDTVSKKVQVQTVANKQPAINSLSVNPSSLQAGATATATVQAGDPLGDTLSYKWSLSDNAWSLSGSGASVQVTAPNSDSSTDLTVTVEDGHGGSVSKTTSITASTALYSFSSHRFTTCGQRGRSGPGLAQCRNVYSTGWDGNGSYFDVQRGIQRWTVPRTGTYRIEVAGAQGATSCGGRGARLRADLQLTQGQKLKILVGQKGNSHNNNSGGGGGGTFVATANDTPLIVAGGGASGINCPANAGDDAVFTEDSSQSRNNGIALGGRTYKRDSRGSCCASGGGGFRGDGETDIGSRGQAFVNGGFGSTGYGNGYGGFGGGGGYSNGGSNVGGGGGGYTGGHGNWGYDSHPAGGGGSFVANAAKNRSNIGQNTGDGFVVITAK